MRGERFVRYLGANVGLYIAWAFLWGVPAIAGLAELSRGDGPPLVYAVGIMTLTLLYFSVLLFLQLLVYLSILYRLPYRRMAAVVLSPLAVGVLFLFASYGTAETVVVFLAGATYGASLWFPHGPRPWWQGRPRLLGAAAAAWIAVTAAVGIAQTLPGGVRTDVAFAVREDGHTAHYRLRCEYDRAWRIRRALPGPEAHPGGVRACEILDDVVSVTGAVAESLQGGCPPGQPSAQLTGKVRSQPFAGRVVAAECDEDYFVEGEANVLIPVPR